MVFEEINPQEVKFEKEEDSIQGILLQKQTDIGPNKANLYGMETPEGVKNVWGATILDQRMDFVKVGDKVKITFKGLGEKKPGQNAPKIFKVEVDKEDQIETQKIE